VWVSEYLSIFPLLLHKSSLSFESSLNLELEKIEKNLWTCVCVCLYLYRLEQIAVSPHEFHITHDQANSRSLHPDSLIHIFLLRLSCLKNTTVKNKFKNTSIFSNNSVKNAMGANTNMINTFKEYIIYIK